MQSRDEIDLVNSEIKHINISSCEFYNNGSTSGPGVMLIDYPEGYDLYSIWLEGNVFRHNSSQLSAPIVEIFNENSNITPDQLDGESKRSLTMRNNTFEENGSHGYGVIDIEEMPNVEISENNRFSSNTDSHDFDTKVLSYFIDNGYYLKDNIKQDEFSSCYATIFLSRCINVIISDLKIEHNSCDASMESSKGFSSGLVLSYLTEGELSILSSDILNNKCDN